MMFIKCKKTQVFPKISVYNRTLLCYFGVSSCLLCTNKPKQTLAAKHILRLGPYRLFRQELKL